MISKCINPIPLIVIKSLANNVAEIFKKIISDSRENGSIPKNVKHVTCNPNIKNKT